MLRHRPPNQQVANWLLLTAIIAAAAVAGFAIAAGPQVTWETTDLIGVLAALIAVIAAWAAITADDRRAAAAQGHHDYRSRAILAEQYFHALVAIVALVDNQALQKCLRLLRGMADEKATSEQLAKEVDATRRLATTMLESLRAMSSIHDDSLYFGVPSKSLQRVLGARTSLRLRFAGWSSGASELTASEENLEALVGLMRRMRMALRLLDKAQREAGGRDYTRNRKIVNDRYLLKPVVLATMLKRHEDNAETVARLARAIMAS